MSTQPQGGGGIRKLTCKDEIDVCDRSDRKLGIIKRIDKNVDVEVKNTINANVDVKNTVSADIIDRCSRLLGQLCAGGSPIDPRDRNWTLDFATDQVDVSGSTITIGSLTQFTPIEKAVIHDQAMPAANTNILLSDITPTNSPTTFKIMISASIATGFNVTITRAATTKTSKFNGGVNLIADTLYIFDILVHSGDSINFQFTATAGTINDLRVQEVDAASA